MEPGEYESLVKRGGTSHASAVELLQAMRTHKIRQPELAVLHGGRLLMGTHRKLGGEVWTVMEQVFLASIEVGADGWRDYCLNKLTSQFPNSTRVERLKGLYQESLEKWADATAIYKKILVDKPEDVPTHKRLIALYKQRGKTPDAIEAINQYLDTFSADAEVWHELAEMYIEAGSLQRAAFCFEEQLLTNKHSLYHVLTYAELMYTLHDYDNSRKYYSLACYLDGACLRALWGLVMANIALTKQDKGNEKMEQLQNFAIQRLKKAYKGTGDHGTLAIEMLVNGL